MGACTLALPCGAQGDPSCSMGQEQCSSWDGGQLRGAGDELHLASQAGSRQQAGRQAGTRSIVWVHGRACQGRTCSDQINPLGQTSTSPPFPAL